MTVISLEEIKQHLRLDSDWEEEDEMLELYGETAEEMVQNDIRRTWSEVEETFGDIPYSLKCACLLLAGHLYKNREPVGTLNQVRIPFTLLCLLKPYERLG